MEEKNRVFIATSLDGYIADKNGELDWLNSIPNPDNIDMGYGEFTSHIDALVMGRKTFETVCGFDIDWPYQKPVFVLSNTMTKIPEKFKDKAQLVKGTLKEILEKIHEMTITTIPILLGGGSPLFSTLPNNIEFECTDSKIYLDKVVQNQYKRKNKDTNANKG